MVKIDFFFKFVIDSSLVWIVDDDEFPIDPNFISNVIIKFRENDNLAAFSFSPRNWWNFIINGKKICPLGSYSVIYRRNLVLKEKLRFSVNGNNPFNSKGWDTGDYLNYVLILKKYSVQMCEIDKVQEHSIGFGATSRVKHFEYGCSKNETLEYFRNPFSLGNHLRNHYKSFYLTTKLMDLYNVIFSPEDKKKPLISSRELFSTLDRINDEAARERFFHEFKLVDDKFKKIYEYLKKINKKVDLK